MNRDATARDGTAHVAPRETLCKSALNTTGIPGYDYCMNPYTGCTHACLYCYASFMCRFTDHSEPWGEFLDVKTNFPEVLAKQLGGRRKHPEGRVLIGTVTDAYQPAEARFRLTAASLELLAEYQLLDVHILTKSDLVRRDAGILRRLPKCEVGFTITTMDRSVSDVLEPGASPPEHRLAAAAELLGSGVSVWVFIAPLLPGLTDTEASLAALYRSLRGTGIRDIRIDRLNPYPGVVRRLKDVYRRCFPKAAADLEACLRDRESYRRDVADRLRRIGA